MKNPMKLFLISTINGTSSGTEYILFIQIYIPVYDMLYANTKYVSHTFQINKYSKLFRLSMPARRFFPYLNNSLRKLPKSLAGKFSNAFSSPGWDYRVECWSLIWLYLAQFNSTRVPYLLACLSLIRHLRSPCSICFIFLF